MTDLEVVRQLLSAGVTRVHRDEDGTRLVQHQLGSFEVEPRHSLVDGDLNALLTRDLFAVANLSFLAA